jgi:hypothetical protein
MKKKVNIKITTKRDILKLINSQLEMVNDSNLHEDNLYYKNKTFRKQLQWLNRFVAKNIKDMPIIVKPINIIKVVDKCLMCLSFIIIAYCFMIPNYVLNESSTMAILRNIYPYFDDYWWLLFIMLIMAIFYVCSGGLIPKSTEKDVAFLIAYGVFLRKLKERIKSMSEREIIQMLNNKRKCK